jgi:thiamine-phosphate pyrophosphorylase
MQELKLCLVTHRKNQPVDSYINFIIQAIQHYGVTSVQLREKNLSQTEVFTFARDLKSVLKPLHIPLIINDYVEIAEAVDAEGVHLGQSDISPTEARKLLGPDKIIGWSIESFSELVEANKLTCLNYVAASAVFPSATKTDCKTIWGLDGLKEIVENSKHPVVAIGGINFSNLEKVMAQGVCGVAMVSALHERK